MLWLILIPTTFNGLTKVKASKLTLGKIYHDELWCDLISRTLAISYEGDLGYLTRGLVMRGT